MKVLLLLSLLSAVPPAVGADRELRVCADPNNLPFSNERREGFENALAELVAKELGRKVSYFWWAQRRGFIRNTLKARRCDVVMGLPRGFEMARITKPYYRSTYVFVSRKGTAIESLDDPALRELRIGVHVVGDDYTNPPPVHALGRRGIVNNVVGFSIYGDYGRANPPLDVMKALERREIDVALIWGPFAGFHAERSPTDLVITPIMPAAKDADLRLTFDIGMGVRKDDRELGAKLDRIIDKRRKEIDRILQSFGVPRVGGPKP